MSTSARTADISGSLPGRCRRRGSRRGRSWCPRSTTTPTRSSEVKSTYGVDDRLRGLLARRAVDAESTRPIGTPATYGAPFWLPQVTTTSPLRGGRRGVDEVEVEAGRRRRADAAAAQEADLHARAEPAADDRVAGRRSAARWRWSGRRATTRPTRPSLLSTVMSGCTPGAGAGVDGDGAARTTAPGPSRRPGPGPARSRCSSAVASRPSSSATPVAVEPTRRRARPCSWEFSASSRATSSRRRRVVRKNRGTAVNGRTAAAVPVSTGPSTVADRGAHRVERGARRRRGRRG